VVQDARLDIVLHEYRIPGNAVGILDMPLGSQIGTRGAACDSCCTTVSVGEHLSLLGQLGYRCDGAIHLRRAEEQHWTAAIDSERTGKVLETNFCLACL